MPGARDKKKNILRLDPDRQEKEPFPDEN